MGHHRASARPPGFLFAQEPDSLRCTLSGRPPQLRCRTKPKGNVKTEAQHGAEHGASFKAQNHRLGCWKGAVMGELCPPQPQNMALFENRVVVDVIVQDGVTAEWGGHLIQYR